MFTKTSIEQYFLAEKSGAFVLMIMGLVAMVLACIFFFGIKTNWYKGAAIALFIVGTWQAAIGLSTCLLYTSRGVKETVGNQGNIVAKSLESYLARHPDMAAGLSRGGNTRFYTTGDTADFDAHAAAFFGRPVSSAHLVLP